MKTYEEKYKKALEWMREVYPTLQGAAKEDAEYYFPELKIEESEDERIKKELIFYLRHQHSISENFKDIGKWIAWLEKQGEQEQLTKYTLEQAARIFLDALSDTPYNNKPVTDAQVITRELLKFLSDARSYNPDALNEQNPAWSEEDEDILNTIINHFKVDIGCTDEDDMVRWLKSLKDRYTWKPSEGHLKALEDAMNKYHGSYSATLCQLYGELEKLKK